MSVLLPAPAPGTDLVPDGWWETTVLPWADAQTDERVLRDTAAQLAGLEAAYREIEADARELTKARRYVEIRWGELLGEADVGTNQHSRGVARMQPLDKFDRHRFRQLAAARDALLAILRSEPEADRLTRAAFLDVAKRFANRRGKRHPGPAPPPEGKYSVLYADPPWRYDHQQTPGRRAIEQEYETRALDELVELEPPAAPDAAIFLWTTAPKLAEALALLEAWRFEYVTCAVWVKDRIGMGYWFRQRHELLLVGRRGQFPPPPVAARADSVIEAARAAHSAKPARVYDLIERMYPDTPRIELWARGGRPGWTSWGNESEAA